MGASDDECHNKYSNIWQEGKLLFAVNYVALG